MSGNVPRNCTELSVNKPFQRDIGGPDSRDQQEQRLLHRPPTLETVEDIGFDKPDYLGHLGEGEPTEILEESPQELGLPNFPIPSRSSRSAGGDKHYTALTRVNTLETLSFKSTKAGKRDIGNSIPRGPSARGKDGESGARNLRPHFTSLALAGGAQGSTARQTEPGPEAAEPLVSPVSASSGDLNLGVSRPTSPSPGDIYGVPSLGQSRAAAGEKTRGLCSPKNGPPKGSRFREHFGTESPSQACPAAPFGRTNTQDHATSAAGTERQRQSSPDVPQTRRKSALGGGLVSRAAAGLYSLIQSTPSPAGEGRPAPGAHIPRERTPEPPGALPDDSRVFAYRPASPGPSRRPRVGAGGFSAAPPPFAGPFAVDDATRPRFEQQPQPQPQPRLQREHEQGRGGSYREPLPKAKAKAGGMNNPATMFASTSRPQNPRGPLPPHIFLAPEYDDDAGARSDRPHYRHHRDQDHDHALATATTPTAGGGGMDPTVGLRALRKGHPGRLKGWLLFAFLRLFLQGGLSLGVTFALATATGSFFYGAAGGAGGGDDADGGGDGGGDGDPADYHRRTALPPAAGAAWVLGYLTAAYAVTAWAYLQLDVLVAGGEPRTWGRRRRLLYLVGDVVMAVLWLGVTLVFSVMVWMPGRMFVFAIDHNNNNNNNNNNIIINDGNGNGHGHDDINNGDGGGIFKEPFDRWSPGERWALARALGIVFYFCLSLFLSFCLSAFLFVAKLPCLRRAPARWWNAVLNHLAYSARSIEGKRIRVEGKGNWDVNTHTTAS